MTEQTDNTQKNNCIFCTRFPEIITPEIEFNEAVIRYTRKSLSFIAPKSWGNNKGSILLISRQHYHDIYDIPEDVISSMAIEKKYLANAARTAYFNCSGITVRNHNEKDGNQTVFHYREHITPRFAGDEFYKNIDNTKIDFSPESRVPYANLIRRYFHLPEIPLASTGNIP